MRSSVPGGPGRPGERCYTAAGFQPVTPEQAAEWNTGQPADYLWFALAT